jgi:cardiolipin synthase
LASTPRGEEHLDGILTAANVVTVVRLACIPVYVYLLFGRHNTTAAAILLAVLGATDWVDGQLARRLSQVSSVGKVLDPVADRVLMVTAIITVAWVGAVPWWFAGLTLAREVLVSAATLLLASLGAKRIDVLFIGKAGTFALMVAYPSFLIGHGDAAWQAWFRGLGWSVGIIGLVLSWAALVSYVGPARTALREGRRARSAAS